MRSQAFGVELETKGLGLEDAARAVARALGGRATGAHVTDPATSKVWKAVRDGSLHGTSAEVVTPKLTYDELPKLQEVVRALRRAGARVDLGFGAFRFRDVKALVNSDHQEEQIEFEFMSEHAIIRNMNEYGRFVKVAFANGNGDVVPAHAAPHAGPLRGAAGAGGGSFPGQEGALS